MPALLAAAACDTGSTPVEPGAPAAGAPDVGIVTDLPSPDRLVGAWIRFEEVEHDGSTLLRTVEWRFDGRGSCRRTVTLATGAGLAPFVDDSVCVYRADGRTIAARFGVDREPRRIAWSLDGRDTLVLDGARFHRAPS